MIASNAAHVATTFRINVSDCIVFLLDEPKIRTRLEVVPSESAGTQRLRTNTPVCGIFTFAILSHLRVVLDKGGHLGENQQKLVFPAVYLKDGGYLTMFEKSGRDSRLLRVNALCRRGLELLSVAISPELDRESV